MNDDAQDREWKTKNEYLQNFDAMMRRAETAETALQQAEERDRKFDIRPWVETDGDSRCQECGRPNPCWFTDVETWERLHPDSGVLCPTCFALRANAHEDCAWKLLPEATVQQLEERNQQLQQRVRGREEELRQLIFDIRATLKTLIPAMWPWGSARRTLVEVVRMCDAAMKEAPDGRT